MANLGSKQDMPRRFLHHSRPAAGPCLMSRGSSRLNPHERRNQISASGSASPAKDSVKRDEIQWWWTLIPHFRGLYKIGSVPEKVKTDSKEVAEVWRRHRARRSIGRPRCHQDGFVSAFSGRNEPDASFFFCVGWLNSRAATFVMW